MVNIIPRAPSFAEEFARNLGAGVSQGVTSASDFAMKIAQKKHEMDLRKKLIEDIKGSKFKNTQPSFQDQVSPKNETSKLSSTGVLASEKLPSFSEQVMNKPSAESYLEEAEQFAAAGEHDLANAAIQKAKFIQKEDIFSREQQERRLEKGYEYNKDYINDLTSSYKSFETETKPKLLQMQQLNEDELIAPGAAAFMEKLELPLGLLENPSNELYSKLSQDLLKGLPETYGSRILQVEVENFLKTIPTLMNSASGRRMIASNMLKLGEMKETFYNEMRKQQMHYMDNDKPLPRDLPQRVFDNVRPQLDRINRDFVQMASIKNVPPNTTPFFNPQGMISFVPNTPEALEWAEKNGGRRIW